MKSLLNVEQWVSDSFPAIQGTLVIIIALTCIILIIGVLASPADVGSGANVITGASESYYTKNRGKNNKGRIRNLVIVCASIIAFCAILYFVAYSIYSGG